MYDRRLCTPNRQTTTMKRLLRKWLSNVSMEMRTFIAMTANGCVVCVCVCRKCNIKLFIRSYEFLANLYRHVVTGAEKQNHYTDELRHMLHVTVCVCVCVSPRRSLS